MACKNIHCPTADNIAKLKRLSSPNRLSRVCRFRRQAERGLPRPRTLPVGIPFESRVLPTRLYFFLVHLQEIASPCAGVRSYRKRSLLPKAFAPAATWTRLCSRSTRTGGWLHSRYRETSASPYQKEGTIARPRSEHLIFLSVGRSGRQLRDSRSYAMVLGDLRRCKTAFYRTGHRATIYGVGAVMRHRSAILYRMSAAIFTR